MNTEKTFADRLKELRNIRNYTQEELGKITNISVQSIRRYEQGGLSTLFQTNFFRLFFRYCTGV